MTDKPYILLTAARNEGDYIEHVLRSVCSQTLTPVKWIIVSDVSTDSTDDVVREYAQRYEFIQFVRRYSDDDRNFGSKVRALALAHEHVGELEYSFIGNLDADVSFGPKYFDRLLDAFQENPRLGIAGGRVTDWIDDKERGVFRSHENVPGAVQMFRRECYEQIGGYTPLKYGGEDTLAATIARTNGWEVRQLPELEVRHHRATGSSGHGILAGRFKTGIRDYLLGTHPLFQCTRSVYRLVERPFILSAAFRFAGFWWATISRMPIEAPAEAVAYLQATQLQRLGLKSVANVGETAPLGTDRESHG